MDDKLSSKINLIRVLEIYGTRLCVKIIVYYDVTNHLIFKQISVIFKFSINGRMQVKKGDISPIMFFLENKCTAHFEFCRMCLFGVPAAFNTRRKYKKRQIFFYL